MAPWGTWRRWCWITAPTTPRSATATRTSGEGSGGGGSGGDPHIALPAPSRRTCPPTGSRTHGRLPLLFLSPSLGSGTIVRLRSPRGGPAWPRPFGGCRATPLQRAPTRAEGPLHLPQPPGRRKETGGMEVTQGCVQGLMCFVCLKSALSTPEAPQLGDSSRN